MQTRMSNPAMIVPDATQARARTELGRLPASLRRDPLTGRIQSHRVTVRNVARHRLRIGPIEAVDGTPVIDIKPALAGRRGF